MPITLECEYCGEEFEVYPSHKDRRRFCSKECQYKWMSENLAGENASNYQGGKVTLECEYCGDKYKVFKKRKDNSRFCSIDCLHKWKSENRVGKNAPRWNGGKKERECKNCGKKFKANPSDNQKFCSRECYDEWQNKQITKICKECGKEFKTQRSRDNDFCSNECQGKYMRGENSPHWKGGYEPYYGKNWPDKRKETLERDDYICQECGKEEDLHVHHKIPLRVFVNNGIREKANRLSNLITLCSSCHRKIEIERYGKKVLAT